MKRMMALAIFAAFSAACFGQDIKAAVGAARAKGAFSKNVSVSPMDKTVAIEGGRIILAPKAEGVEYKISGYFNGQIVNKTKNTVIKLENAFIENTRGESAIYGEAKTEISAAKASENYVVCSGASEKKTAALQCKKNLVIGGSGTLYVCGQIRHGAKADDVKIKGSGTYYFCGTKDGSALNCRSLAVEREKSFKAYFVDSKNGIKADNTIEIASGTFYIYNNATALKTDTKKDAPQDPHGISLLGGVFHVKGNARLHSTEKDGYKAARAAKIVED